jgi:hypothetical protein
LLSSPHYGERWARHWLDIARFAESDGFERDKIRDHAWPYRDYVIGAFNQDLPYDRFVREQVAGDVLSEPGPASIAATGFLVAGPRDEVGQQQASVLNRARVREDELEEMVSAVGQTFLAVTVNCARCHDHKFDPIPQRDYFQLQALLAGVHSGDRPLVPEAEVEERKVKRAALEAALASARSALAAVEGSTRARLAAERNAAEAPKPYARWTFEGTADDAQGRLPLTLSGGAEVVGGRLRLNGRDGLARSVALPAPLGPKTLEAWVVLENLDRAGGVLTVENAAGDVFDALSYAERQPRRWVAGSDFFARTRDLAAPAEDAAPGQLIHVAISYEPDGGITVYRNGVPYAPTYRPMGENGSLRTYGADDGRVLLGLRHSAGAQPGDRRWLAGEIEEARLYDRALGPEEIAASHAAGPTLISATEVQEALSAAEREAYQAAQDRLARLTLEHADVRDVPQAWAAVSKPAPVVHLLQRGDIQQPGEVVAPAGLSILTDLPADLGLAPDASDAERRRKLGDWLTHPHNPLTPRVMVNRVWQHHFTRGLAANPSDFGANGEPPTHPELLDWLASTFVAPAEKGGMGWSLKRLHRLIVTSNSYKQSARGKPATLEADPENLLWGRMALRRLDAEQLRDAVLLVSGQLNPERGGPGFRPFNVIVSSGRVYEFEDRLGPEFHRRSIYRTIVNSGGVPLLDVFDCPDPSVKTPRRVATTTPLQALSLMNNSFILRSASALAARVEAQAGSQPERQVERAYQLALGREPAAGEQEAAALFVREHGLPAFCRVLFNTSEFLYVR